jgi:hypothetical protein
MEQMFRLSMLMHNCCAYDCLYLLILLYLLTSMYVCHLLMYTCSCLFSPVIAYAAYACLCSLSICLWAMISVKEFSIGLRGMEGREVFILVLYQERRIYVYKRTCPPIALSFFCSSRNVLYFYPIQPHLSLSLISSLSPSVQPSQAPPVLAEPRQACPAQSLPLPYRKFPGL